MAGENFRTGEALTTTDLFLSMAEHHGIREEVEELLRGKYIPPDSPSLGDLLLNARRRQDMTILQVFRRSGISRSQLSFYESGRQKNPGIRTIQALAYGYRIPFGLLLIAALRDIRPRSRIYPLMLEAPRKWPKVRHRQRPPKT